ncbi:hypothetical protein PRVXT_000540 [Proteinivorax tanatarense]|uniref:PDZ domain-containing protein n=1 Tax=Proteinivorax tanatarense TaxID=1260629 RepID=A0AAU7VNK9_9FIRM
MLNLKDILTDIVNSSVVQVIFGMLSNLYHSTIGGLINFMFGAGPFPPLLVVLPLVFYIVFKQYKKQTIMERKLFGISITNPYKETVISTAYGVIGGLIGSFVLIFIGVEFASVGIVFVWPIAILLMLINPRYMCFAYAGGFVGVLVLLTRLIVEVLGVQHYGSEFLEAFLSINLPGLMVVVGVLHLVESGLIFLSGAKGITPIYFERKDKKGYKEVIGGFTLQRFWPVPLVVLFAMAIPSGELVVESSSIQMPSWWPLIEMSQQPPPGHTVTMVMFSVIAAVGYSELAFSTTPKKKSRDTAKNLGIYSTVLVLLAIVANFFPLLTFLPVIFAPLGHELLVLYSQHKEFSKEPLFPTNDGNGIVVLGILPGSVGEKLGLEPGFRIKRINGQNIESYFDYQHLIAENPTYLKMEVEDLHGRLKFLKAPLFQRRRQLGIITMPDGTPKYMASFKFNSPLEKIINK